MRMVLTFMKQEVRYALWSFHGEGGSINSFIGMYTSREEFCLSRAH
jgi:hypothetical protein